MSDDEYTPVPKRPDPAKENAVDPGAVPGKGKPADSANKDPDDMPKGITPPATASCTTRRNSIPKSARRIIPKTNAARAS
ncbi:hypothetical protein [Croceicoccus sp. YJ47]|uniref:hypothetical protein n=1 Tax=Croceicoccus sp. YJ47 TaxID=2798724 RepID=UPI0019225407|nr:hypothetical protein [Croceicoccus sp. YJ47]QQN74176.1 hypothetical protein JD971_15900 [Croceicoccus sp. YJ47]